MVLATPRPRIRLRQPECIVLISEGGGVEGVQGEGGQGPGGEWLLIKSFFLYKEGIFFFLKSRGSRVQTQNCECKMWGSSYCEFSIQIVSQC